MSTQGSAEARFPPIPRRRSRRRLVPLRLRLRVLARRERLDRLLLAGADPVSDPELTVRAFQLTRASSRSALAASLDATVATAASRRRRSSAAAPLACRAIAAARPQLEDLAAALRETPVVAPRGVLLVRRLLTDGSGPLFADCGEGVLVDTAEDARAALGERV